MSAPRPYEQTLLQAADALLSHATSKLPVKARYEGRVQLLEASASRLGTFSAEEYFKLFGVEALFAWNELDAVSAALVAEFQRLPMHPSLALSALAREPLAVAAQKEAGSYY